jgi:uncharacterized ubiquitin-like protein YukD
MGGGEDDAVGELGAPGSELATLHIRYTNGSKFPVRIDLSATVAALKAIVAESCDVPAPQQRLIYKGRILKDDQTLASYGTCLPYLFSEEAVRFAVICCTGFDRLDPCFGCDTPALILPGW